MTIDYLQMTINPTHNSSKPISSGILGMIFLLVTEFMFFSGLISAYLVNRSSFNVWPPFGQPRFPVGITGLNTVILFCSFFTLLNANKLISINHFEKIKRIRKLFFISIVAGLIFVLVQGYEWINLILFGLNASASLYSAFFYIIIGTHAIHAIVGLIVLWYGYNMLLKFSVVDDLVNKIQVISLYWYFVVGIWPLLYMLVYLF